MRLLITGGAGFIGSHLADCMLAEGHDIVVVDSFATGRRDNLAPHPRLQVVQGSIADAAVVDAAFEVSRPDVVVHAAAAYRDPLDWAEDARTNVLGSVHVVRAAAQHGARRLINLQTALCYGLSPLEQPVTLAHPVRGDGSSYAISKTAGEGYVSLGAVEFLSFRLANVYGPRNVSGPLPTFYKRLAEGQRCVVMDTRRDFTYVDDVVDVLRKAVMGAGKQGHYHICTGKDVSIRELYERTRAAMGLPPDVALVPRHHRDDDAVSILLDPSRTQSDFDWSPRVALEEGIERTVWYYRQAGVPCAYTHLQLPAA